MDHLPGTHASWGSVCFQWLWALVTTVSHVDVCHSHPPFTNSTAHLLHAAILPSDGQWSFPYPVVPVCTAGVAGVDIPA